MHYPQYPAAVAAAVLYNDYDPEGKQKYGGCNQKLNRNYSRILCYSINNNNGDYYYN